MFTQYTPKVAIPHVLYAKDEKGNDWYDFSRGLDKTTAKILVSEKGQVTTMGTDAEKFPFPDRLSLFEVDKLPTTASIAWFYIDNKFVPYEETEAYKLSQEKAGYVKTMATSKEIIDALRIEKEYSDLSEEKAEQLKQAARDYTEAKSSLDALNGTSN